MSCSTSAPVGTANEAAIPVDQPFQLGRPCFSGPRSTYDGWASLVTSRDDGPDLASFERRIPRDEYDKYKRDLNCNFIAYAVGELTIRGILIRPNLVNDKKLPVVVINRGGNGGYGAWNAMRLFHSALPLASEGFVVIGSQYRGSRKGQSKASDGADEFGGRDVDDVMALFELIDKMPGVDPGQIGMLGWSRGGMMTYIAATRSDRLNAVAVAATPTDLAAELKLRPAMERVFRARIPDYDSDKQSALASRSAIKWAQKIEQDLPILILHGDKDKRVSVDSAVNMATVLRQLNHPYKLVVYENGTHGLMEHKAAVRRELANWFRTHLTGE